MTIHMHNALSPGINSIDRNWRIFVVHVFRVYLRAMAEQYRMLEITRFCVCNYAKMVNERAIVIHPRRYSITRTLR